MSVPSTSESQKGGALPPSRLRTKRATIVITAAAIAKRRAADWKGGRSRRPTRITYQVLPQMRHISVMKRLASALEGMGAE